MRDTVGYELSTLTTKASAIIYTSIFKENDVLRIDCSLTLCKIT